MQKKNVDEMIAKREAWVREPPHCPRCNNPNRPIMFHVYQTFSEEQGVVWDYHKVEEGCFEIWNYHMSEEYFVCYECFFEWTITKQLANRELE